MVGRPPHPTSRWRGWTSTIHDEHPDSLSYFSQSHNAMRREVAGNVYAEKSALHAMPDALSQRGDRQSLSISPMTFEHQRCLENGGRTTEPVRTAAPTHAGR